VCGALWQNEHPDPNGKTTICRIGLKIDGEWIWRADGAGDTKVEAEKGALPLGHVLIDLPPLSETDRLSVWEHAMVGTGCWLRDAAGLAARYRVGPGIIHRAVAAAVTDDNDPTKPCDDDIELFLRDAKHIDAGLKAYAEPPRTALSAKSRRIVAQTDDWVPPEERHAAG